MKYNVCIGFWKVTFTRLRKFLISKNFKRKVMGVVFLTKAF